jgi:hypothetical protein
LPFTGKRNLPKRNSEYGKRAFRNRRREISERYDSVLIFLFSGLSVTIEAAAILFYQYRFVTVMIFDLPPLSFVTAKFINSKINLL